MTEEQIKYMRDRFLAWKLPANFNPDDGISFDPISNKGHSFERRREPTGTNLFNADQADAMVRHLVDGMPGEEGDEKTMADILVKAAGHHPAGCRCSDCY